MHSLYQEGFSNALYILTHYSFKTLCEAGTITIHTLQVRKVKHQDVC